MIKALKKCKIFHFLCECQLAQKVAPEFLGLCRYLVVDLVLERGMGSGANQRVATICRAVFAWLDAKHDLIVGEDTLAEVSYGPVNRNVRGTVGNDGPRGTSLNGLAESGRQLELEVTS